MRAVVLNLLLNLSISFGIWFVLLYCFGESAQTIGQKEIAQLHHILSQAHHKPQKRYGEVCAIERDLCVFGFLLVFFSEVVIRERKLSNKYMSLTRTRCKYTQNSSISILKPRKTYKA